MFAFSDISSPRTLLRGLPTPGYAGAADLEATVSWVISVDGEELLVADAIANIARPPASKQSSRPLSGSGSNARAC